MSNRDAYTDGMILLLRLFQGIDPEHKSKYRTKIWDMFEANVRVSANQSDTLSKFVSRIAVTMRAQLGRNASERSDIDTIVSYNDGKDILRLYRRETSRMILLTRLELQTIRDSYEEQ